METVQCNNQVTKKEAGPELKKYSVQLTLVSNNTIKKVSDAPASVKALRRLCKAELKETEDIWVTSIEYVDSEGDNIIVQDDDDLRLAYEWAEQANKSMLTLNITAILRKDKPKKEKKVDDPSSEKTPKEKKEKKEKKPKAERLSKEEYQQLKMKRVMKKVIKRTIKDQTKEIIESIEKVVFERDLEVYPIDAPKMPILVENLQD